MKLEELARQSSVAARTSVSRLEPPPIGAPSTGRRIVPVAIAAGLLAVVTGGLVVLTRDDPDARVPAEQVPVVTDLPRLGLPPDATGWTPSHASDIDDVAGDAVGSPTFSYFGRAGEDDPFADGDLVIGVLSEGDASDMEGDPVMVRATTGVLLDPTGMPDEVVGIGWTEVDPTGDQLEIMLASRSYTVDELVSIADGLTIDVAAATVVPDGSVDLELLTDDGGASFLSIARGTQQGSFVAYEGDAIGTVIVTTVAGDAAATETELRWWTSDARAVTIGEHEGIAAELATSGESGSTNRIVLWAPEPGVVASVSYYGPTDDVDPVALAASVIELDPAEWATLVDAASTPSTSTDMDVTYASDTGEIAGTPFAWAVGLKDGDLCVEIAEGNSSSGSCQDPGPAAPPIDGARTVENMFSEHVGIVLVAADTAVDDVVDPSGVWSVVSVSVDEDRFFVAVGPSDVQPTFDVIVDGEVADTLDAATTAVEAAVQEIVGFAEVTTDEFPVFGTEERELDAVIGGGDADGMRWVLGTSGEEECVATAGPVDTLRCSLPWDVVVHPPITGTATPDTTIVVVHHDPQCAVELVVPDVAMDEVVAAGDGSTTVFIVRSISEGWFLEVQNGADGRSAIELPALEGGSDLLAGGDCAP